MNKKSPHAELAEAITKALTTQIDTSLFPWSKPKIQDKIEHQTLNLFLNKLEANSFLINAPIDSPATLGSIFWESFDERYGIGPLKSLTSPQIFQSRLTEKLEKDLTVEQFQTLESYLQQNLISNYLDDEKFEESKSAVTARLKTADLDKNGKLSIGEFLIEYAAEINLKKEGITLEEVEDPKVPSISEQNQPALKAK